MENITQKVTDLRRMADERKQQQLTRKPVSPSRQTFGTMERPASRAEISALEVELEEKVRLILDNNYKRTSDEFGADFIYEPHRENMLITREKMLKEFNASSKDLTREPWLENFVQCECLRILCDEIALKFSDMLGVASSEWGSISRKLRLTYSQSFQHMLSSWKALRLAYLSGQEELEKMKKHMDDLQYALDHKEEEVAKRLDAEVQRITKEFNLEKERDKEKLLQAELKVDQMSDTLKYLNGIFRTMQIDGPALKTADLQALNTRLEKENRDLKVQQGELENVRSQLVSTHQRGKQLEGQIKTLEGEIAKLNTQLTRREELVNQLLEREAVRNAELEKLQKLSKLKEEEQLAVDMSDPATSVLCIKCKKSLDDLSNIRAAILGDGHPSHGGNNQRLTCESFRILLPNLRGKRPHRPVVWIRASLRAILMAKLSEDSEVLPLRYEVTTFPAFLFSWFSRKTDGLVGTNLSRAWQQADEDRWGIYYGLKSLSKEDSECAFFWGLLDESFGQDGLQFALYCLSVVLSFSGYELGQHFLQARQALTLLPGAHQHQQQEEMEKVVRSVLWVDLQIARQATDMILKKALAPQLAAALEAIDAMKAKPVVDSPPVQGNGSDGKVAGAITPLPEATHLNLFTWLRIMLQQLQADQIHRKAAIRLMFETASVGALTPALSGTSAGNSSTGGASGGGGGVQHVEFPQFLSICQTLFPFLAASSVAELYNTCHSLGNRRVTAEIFTAEAERRSLFAYALRLPPLPLYCLTPPPVLPVPAPAPVPAPTIANEGETTGDAVVATSASDKPLYSGHVKLMLRSKLAALVHRKYVCVRPALQHLSSRLSERARGLLQEASQAVEKSLADSYTLLRAAYMQQLTSGGGSGGNSANKNDVATPYLDDGLQPYLCYRRLLSLTASVVAWAENPLLPHDLFGPQPFSSSSSPPRHRLSAATHQQVEDEGLRQAVYRAEKLLSHLEQALLVPMQAPGTARTTVAPPRAVAAAIPLPTPMGASQSESSSSAPVGAALVTTPASINTGSYLAKKYTRYESIRQTILARKIQISIRRFLGRDVPVPRSVRFYMAAGYLSNIRRQPAGNNQQAAVGHNVPSSVPSYTSASISASTIASSLLHWAPLRSREVYHDPWWAQTHVAGIYLYKLAHDHRAQQMGLPPLPLAHAVAAYHYYLWGAIEVAERAIHDLFLAIRAYKLGLSRLRLFAALLGDAKDLDETVAQILRTPQAVAVYLHLLLDVHKEVQRYQKHILRLANDDIDNDVEDGKKQQHDEENVVIETLFPSSEDPLRSNGRKEAHLLDTALLQAVAQRFTASQPWVANRKSIYVDLVDRLRSDAQGRVDVDDFLYITMVQWARLAHFHLLQCANRTIALESNGGGLGSSPSHGNYTPSGGGSHMVGTTSTLATPVAAARTPGSSAPLVSAVSEGAGKATRRISMLPLNNLQSLVHSVYAPASSSSSYPNGGVAGVGVDVLHYAAAYLDCIRSRRNDRLRTIQAGGGTDEEKQDENVDTKHHWDARCMAEMQVLLRDCVLWDTSIPIFTTPDSPPVTSTTGRPTSGSVTITRTSLGGGGSHQTALGSNLANLFIPPLADGEVGGPLSISLFAPKITVLYGTAPEMELLSAKLAFASYQSPCNLFLNQVSDEIQQQQQLGTAEEQQQVEIRTRIQALRLHLLSLTDFFQSIDIHCPSAKLYALSMVYAGREADDELEVYREEKKQYRVLAQQAREKMQMLMSLISELVTMTQHDFPRDAWTAGSRVALDRAFVYSVHTKSALI